MLSRIKKILNIKGPIQQSVLNRSLEILDDNLKLIDRKKAKAKQAQKKFLLQKSILTRNNHVFNQDLINYTTDLNAILHQYGRDIRMPRSMLLDTKKNLQNQFKKTKCAHKNFIKKRNDLTKANNALAYNITAFIGKISIKSGDKIKLKSMCTGKNCANYGSGVGCANVGLPKKWQTFRIIAINKRLGTPISGHDVIYLTSSRNNMMCSYNYRDQMFCNASYGLAGGFKIYSADVPRSFSEILDGDVIAISKIVPRGTTHPSSMNVMCRAARKNITCNSTWIQACERFLIEKV